MQPELSVCDDEDVPLAAHGEPIPAAEPGGAQVVAEHRWYPPCKAAADRIVAVLLLLLTGPLVLCLGLLAKLAAPGPMFYRQRRMGEKGRIYWIYKIRTMRCESEAETGPVWSPRHDSRVTRVGWFLRATHLDELPQLWNVACGEMSLIGPRPERPELIPEIERQVPGYRGRVQVRPGLTGMAQVHLLSDTRIDHVRRKLVYDLYYVRNMSPWLDARILICTGFYLIAALANTQCKLVMLPDRNPTQRELAGGGSADPGDYDDSFERPWTA